MTIQETVQQLQQAPLLYRIQVMDLLLQSLRDEIAQRDAVKRDAVKIARKPFRIREFSLGTDICFEPSQPEKRFSM